MKKLYIIAAVVLLTSSMTIAKDKITQADLDAANLRAAQATRLALQSKIETIQLQFIDLNRQLKQINVEIAKLTPAEKKKGKKVRGE